MTVKDFLPIDDAKQVVEKEVKEKPKLKDLITIESPGKSISEDVIDSGEESKPKRKKKKATSTARIESPKRDSVLIITEKPQAAQKIAFALGDAKKYSDNNVAYYELLKEGKKIIVASAVGHLFTLEYKKGQTGWPVFEVEWRPSYERKNSSFTKKYFDLLKKLSRRAEEFVIATDYDVEGEVIGWNVLRFICGRETAKRMKYSTLTSSELKKSFSSPMPEPDWGQAYAGETRHILDWLYGVNLSRALMSSIKKVGSFKLLSIGRVQGPALKIIVEREIEIKNFKPRQYWQVFAQVKGFDFKHPKDIFEKKELEKFKDIKDGEGETKEKREKIPPSHPFDLTTLQREAYRVHKMSPSQTLATAQKLYLDGLISYPRTSSQKIPSSIEPKKILKLLEKNYPDIKNITRTKPVEGKKSDPAHPSIYPTGETRKLSEDEKSLYDLIVRRFISVFSADAIVTNKKTEIKTKDNIKFSASGLKVIEKGWTKIYPITLEEKDVPTLNGKVEIEKIKNIEKETQPPKRYTPASLISNLERKNLGTKATRSTIVDTLFSRGYLEGKSIKATPLGIKLIESLETNSPIIIDENLTRQLEEEMEKIQESKSDFEKKEKEVVEKAKHLITDISKEFKAREVEIGRGILQGIGGLREYQDKMNTLRICPQCGKGELRILYSKKTGRYFVGCSNYPNCTQTYSLPPNALIKKSEKDCEVCGFPKLLSIKKGRKPWEFCFNPECETRKKTENIIQ
ncbi:DNA topoisomerase I [Candidatus Pacearchaeota archaeon]|nr:DNA topoisomerase I [Candidatus Pacearchaeota archaeon]